MEGIGGGRGRPARLSGRARGNFPPCPLPTAKALTARSVSIQAFWSCGKTGITDFERDTCWFCRAVAEQKIQTDCHLGIVNCCYDWIPILVERREVRLDVDAFQIPKDRSPGLQIPVSYTAPARRPLLPEPVLLNVNKAKQSLRLNWSLRFRKVRQWRRPAPNLAPSAVCTREWEREHNVGIACWSKMVTVDLEKCPRCDKAVYEAESAFAGTLGASIVPCYILLLRTLNLNPIKNCPKIIKRNSIELPYLVTFVWFGGHSLMSTFQSDFCEYFDMYCRERLDSQLRALLRFYSSHQYYLICLRLAVQYARSSMSRKKGQYSPIMSARYI